MTSPVFCTITDPPMMAAAAGCAIENVNARPNTANRPRRMDAKLRMVPPLRLKKNRLPGTTLLRVDCRLRCNYRGVARAVDNGSATVKRRARLTHTRPYPVDLPGGAKGSTGL